MYKWLKKQVDQLEHINNELTRAADAHGRNEDIHEIMSNLQYDVVRMLEEAKADYDAF